MKLPRGEDAIIADGKIETYCLDVTHEIGGPKARVFASALGLTVHDAGLLRAALLAAVRTHEAVLFKQDIYGEHYRVDFRLSHASRADDTEWLDHSRRRRSTLPDHRICVTFVP